MALVPHSSVIPPGGYHLIDNSTGVPVRIEGTSPEDVAKKVLEFRLSNQKAPGNPLQEVNDFICSSWPHFCRETNPGEQVAIPRSRSRIHISTRVATWMAAFIRGFQRDPGVHPSVAERRAVICAQCPKNVSFASGCGACQDSIARLSFIWKRDRATAMDKQLGACEVTSQHNGCAVWAEKLPPVDATDELPGFCWRKSG